MTPPPPKQSQVADYTYRQTLFLTYLKYHNKMAQEGPLVAQETKAVAPLNWEVIGFKSIYGGTAYLTEPTHMSTSDLHDDL